MTNDPFADVEVVDSEQLFPHRPVAGRCHYFRENTEIRPIDMAVQKQNVNRAVVPVVVRVGFCRLQFDWGPMFFLDIVDFPFADRGIMAASVIDQRIHGRHLAAVDLEPAQYPVGTEIRGVSGTSGEGAVHSIIAQMCSEAAVGIAVVIIVFFARTHPWVALPVGFRSSFVAGLSQIQPVSWI